MFLRIIVESKLYLYIYFYILFQILQVFSMVFCLSGLVHLSAADTQDELDQLRKTIDDLKNDLQKTIGQLGRQVLLQQFSLEERTRLGSNSGLKQTRTFTDGSRPYLTTSHNGHALAAIHDHANNIRTVGLGELNVVLNGVEFATRHNDYAMSMPSTTSKKYMGLQEIPYPEVPPEVTNKDTLKEQTDELREWFRAFKEQDHSVRDYRKYFKPTLCYMEGYWTTAVDKLDESFPSDRHFMDAATWFEMQEKVRFASASGRKSNSENYSFLPTTILEVANGTTPVYGQWNYRIACHPLKNDLPLNRLRLSNEMHARMFKKNPMDKHLLTRAARFEVNPVNSDKWKDRSLRRTFLDELMGEVPGLDNYGANLTDNSFDNLAQDPFTGETINSGFYNRWFRTSAKDAMGESVHHRGFSDGSVYMAMNTQEPIATSKLTVCVKKEKKKCIEEKTTEQKWSYAIPLEIIYLTPLINWNPYDIAYKGWQNSPQGRTVVANGRNGGFSPEKAYNGNNRNKYFRTPAEFFSGEVDGGNADTSGGNVGVLDKKGNVRTVRASGIKAIQSISGIGPIRTRYPIVPVHGHGQAVWKELEAVKDIVLSTKSYAHMFTERIGQPENSLYKTGMSKSSPKHTHKIELTPEEYSMIATGHAITKNTSVSEDHSHTVTLRDFGDGPLIHLCDGQKYCPDGHRKLLLR